MAGMVVTVAVALQGEMAGMEETEEAGLRVVMAATVATVAMAIVLIRLGGMAVMEGMGAIAVTMGKEEKELQERMELMVEMEVMAAAIIHQEGTVVMVVMAGMGETPD
ncbi:hypothetical protein WKH24_01120 [Pantoea agglomerans]|jgi:hypothetical protein|uniref:Uncharacterized protein n=1 Tax=Enterobacter agglomerans TaxID=549 RepID=A0ACC5PRY6_ENTAG|nr:MULTISPECIES: hypothetical protein [Pantoea]KAF6638764.1 hypothetical protein HFD95_05220 [Pantoea sp. EKM10T]KPA07310.1 putative membrane protein [Pantoea agglomerans]MBD8127689.1 hypothetical protein [Pantoea agglomerans]MBD8153527.1 hypothetical protein [Pantoea agglomerans]MBD8243645.1 hypothetical protein [Pantoea agglomerans]